VNDPVRLVVGLAAPDEEGHVTALATLADYLLDESRREALIGAADPAEIRRLIVAFEGQGGHGAESNVAGEERVKST
jgi:mannitol/fructose-specific phosphotransferase system IIA component (Ntr-type)